MCAWIGGTLKASQDPLSAMGSFSCTESVPVQAEHGPRDLGRAESGPDLMLRLKMADGFEREEGAESEVEELRLARLAVRVEQEPYVKDEFLPELPEDEDEDP